MCKSLDFKTPDTSQTLLNIPVFAQTLDISTADFMLYLYGSLVNRAVD